jgi:hypothetical protein
MGTLAQLYARTTASAVIEHQPMQVYHAWNTIAVQIVVATATSFRNVHMYTITDD